MNYVMILIGLRDLQLLWIAQVLAGKSRLLPDLYFRAASSDFPGACDANTDHAAMPKRLKWLWIKMVDSVQIGWLK